MCLLSGSAHVSCVCSGMTAKISKDVKAKLALWVNFERKNTCLKLHAPLRVAVIGAGPAGIYAADLLTKSEEYALEPLRFLSTFFDRYPRAFRAHSLRCGARSPAHQGIITALHKVLDRGDISILRQCRIR